LYPISVLPASPVAPDVEVKGESAVYFLLVQGSDDVESRACTVRMIHSVSQINGAATMATISSLLSGKSPSSGIFCVHYCHCKGFDVAFIHKTVAAVKMFSKPDSVGPLGNFHFEKLTP